MNQAEDQDSNEEKQVPFVMMNWYSSTSSKIMDRLCICGDISTILEEDEESSIAYVDPMMAATAATSAAVGCHSVRGDFDEVSTYDEKKQYHELQQLQQRQQQQQQQQMDDQTRHLLSCYYYNGAVIPHEYSAGNDTDHWETASIHRKETMPIQNTTSMMRRSSPQHEQLQDDHPHYQSFGGSPQDRLQAYQELAQPMAPPYVLRPRSDPHRSAFNPVKPSTLWVTASFLDSQDMEEDEMGVTGDPFVVPAEESSSNATTAVHRNPNSNKHRQFGRKGTAATGPVHEGQDDSCGGSLRSVATPPRGKATPPSAHKSFPHPQSPADTHTTVSLSHSFTTESSGEHEPSLSRQQQRQRQRKDSNEFEAFMSEDDEGDHDADVDDDEVILPAAKSLFRVRQTKRWSRKTLGKLKRLKKEKKESSLSRGKYQMNGSGASSGSVTSASSVSVRRRGMKRENSNNHEAFQYLLRMKPGNYLSDSNDTDEDDDDHDDHHQSYRMQSLLNDYPSLEEDDDTDDDDDVDQQEGQQQHQLSAPSKDFEEDFFSNSASRGRGFTTTAPTTMYDMLLPSTMLNLPRM